MKIANLRTFGFDGLPDREFDFTAPGRTSPSPLVVVVGPPSSGKTRLLEAIAAAKEAAGAYAERPQKAAYLRDGAEAVKFVTRWAFDEEEQRRVGLVGGDQTTETILGDMPDDEDDGRVVSLLRTYRLEPGHGKMEYFHAARALPSGGVRAGQPSVLSAFEARDRLRPTNAKYAALLGFVVDATMQGSPAAAAVQEAFAALCPTKRLVDAYVGTVGLMLAFETPDRRRVRFDQLTEAERDALLVAATFVRSRLDRSIILFDEPERHRPYADVGRFITALGQLGAENQLIVATRAAEHARDFSNALVIQLG